MVVGYHELEMGVKGTPLYTSEVWPRRVGFKGLASDRSALPAEADVAEFPKNERTIVIVVNEFNT